jgi:hypothetical protein
MALFEVLDRHRDAVGRPAVITADYAVSNPNFKKIIENGFSQYFFESIRETYRAYEGSANVLDISKKGVEAGIWFPQLHCREHLQIERWMKALQQDDDEIMWAFEHDMISTADAIEDNNHYAYMDAFNYSVDQKEIINLLIDDAVKLFEELFGYKSKTFVASCYVWNNVLEEILHEHGIYNMQASWYQWIPNENNSGYFYKRIHYNGEISGKQLYTVRNCLLEHSLFGENGGVERCLKQIDSAFRWHQPAIISSHRVNYIGRIDENNRKIGLRLLDELLTKVCCRWPDVEFVTSSELSDIYRNERFDS